jgi:hypothetical protein
MAIVLEKSPGELGINGVDLKVADNTEYASGFLELDKFRMFMASVITTKTGSPSVGAAKLSIDLYAKDKTTLLSRVDLLTAIGLTVSRTELVTFGRGLTPAKQGNGTIGAGIGVVTVFRWAKLILTVTTLADGTTNVGSVRLFGVN